MSWINNPFLMAGLGILGGNTGPGAAAGAARGGLLGLQQAQRAQEAQGLLGLRQAQMQQESEQDQVKRAMDLQKLQLDYMKYMNPQPGIPTGMVRDENGQLVYDPNYLAGQMQMKAPAVQINLESMKPLGNDANNWKGPEGEPVSPLVSPQEAYESGARPKTEVEKIREKKSAEDQIKAESTAKGAPELMQDYVDAFKAYQEGWAWDMPNRNLAAMNKEALAAFVAKAILGTPGAEPNDQVMEIARNLVPDFSGPIDRKSFPTQMKQIAKMIKDKTGIDINLDFGESKKESGRNGTALPPGAKRVD